MNISERRLERLEASANSEATHAQKQADFYRVCLFFLLSFFFPFFLSLNTLSVYYVCAVPTIAAVAVAAGIEQSGPLGGDPALRIGAIRLQ